MSSTGAAIVFWGIADNGFWGIADNGGNTIWRAATRGGTPEGVAVNGAGESAVAFHEYSPDYLTYILYMNTYHP
jgi:hypothetical protein